MIHRYIYKIYCLIYLFFLSALLTSCSSYRNIRNNYISFSKHPVQGLDVSHHQGEIDWAKVSTSKFTFVFMKATEGGDLVDKRFAYNFSRARQHGLIVGAYHFFSFKRTGKEQAENFIATVPNLPGMLPPVIDLEYMGRSNEKDSKEKLHRELDIYIDKIEKAYNVKPILYTNYRFYERYLEGHYTDCSIWICDYYHPPQLPDRRPWLFWQYTDRGKVTGIRGYVDFNVFNGEKEELMTIVQ
ncbi:MAG: GH25 family lysozyme [Spirochaetes bacterium]|jgi:lysozyme|nr:GH25 family lysozyme [Spirochaetota bacterium]